MKNMNQPKISIKCHLLTFHTEGSPFDNGTNMIKTAKDFSKLATPHFDSHIQYTPRICTERFLNSSKYFKDYSNWLNNHPLKKQLKNYNQSWVKLGFQSWKALIIKKTLESPQLNHGDILFYHDSDIKKYPKYGLYIHEWKSTAIQILNKICCDVFAPAGNPLYKDVKAYAIRKHLKRYSQFKIGLWNGLIIIKKSKTSLKFFNEYLDLCGNKDIISPLPNPNPYPGHIWHSPDQAVFSIVANKWKENRDLPKNWAFIFRRR